jgi:twitching motility protein PilT
MMQVGKALGMVSLNEALFDYVQKKMVTPDEAYSKAVDKAAFEALLKRANIKLSLPTEKPAAAAP